MTSTICARLHLLQTAWVKLDHLLGNFILAQMDLIFLMNHTTEQTTDYFLTAFVKEYAYVWIVI